MQTKTICEILRAWSVAISRAQCAYFDEVSTYVRLSLDNTNPCDFQQVDCLVGIANELNYQTGFCFFEMCLEVSNQYPAINEEEGNSISVLLQNFDTSEGWFLRMMAALSTETKRADYFFRLVWERYTLQIRLLIRDVLQVAWLASNTPELVSAMRLVSEVESASIAIGFDEAWLSPFGVNGSWLANLRSDDQLEKWFLASWTERRSMQLVSDASESECNSESYDKCIRSAAQRKLEQLLESQREVSSYSPLVKKSLVHELKDISRSQYKRMVIDGRIRTKDDKGQYARFHYDDVEGLREHLHNP